MQEFRMRSMGAGKKQRTVEGVNMIKIHEKPPPTPAEEGSFQPYNDEFPSILKDIVSEESWAKVMEKVNDLWRPIHEESMELTTAVGWWDYTVFGVWRRHNKQTKLAAKIPLVAKMISDYLDQVNRSKQGYRLYIKQTNGKANAAEEDDLVYPVFHLELRLKPKDPKREPNPGSATPGSSSPDND